MRGRSARNLRLWAGLVLTISLAGCDGAGVTLGPNPIQNPIITRFEVFQNPQNPGTGPFELLAQANGVGILNFRWSATGGLLSVATQSLPASAVRLTPSLNAWQPPNLLGTYEVSLTVQDSGGKSYRRFARFEVEQNFVRILAPVPSQVSPPGVFILAK